MVFSQSHYATVGFPLNRKSGGFGIVFPLQEVPDGRAPFGFLKFELYATLGSGLFLQALEASPSYGIVPLS